jgi:hypothetical protein
VDYSQGYGIAKPCPIEELQWNNSWSVRKKIKWK